MKRESHRDETPPPGWHAVPAVVPAGGSLVVHAGAAAGRPALHACKVVESIAEALSRPPRSRPDGTPEPPTWLVAPSRRIGQQWVESLARTGYPVVNLQATTISALAFDVLADDLTAEAREVAPPGAKRAILEKLIRTIEPPLESLAGSSVSPRRLAALVLSSIDALRMAGVTPEQVASCLRDGNKGRDLARLMSRYEQELDALNLIDAAGELARASAAVGCGALPTTIERLLVPEDLDLTTRERYLLQAFRNCRTVEVIDLPVDGPLPEGGIERRAHAGSGQQGAAWSVRFFRASGEANEVRHVLRICLAKGIRFDEVEIVHTDGSTYPALIREIVSALPQLSDLELSDRESEASKTQKRPTGVPVTFAEGLPVRDSKPGRALVAWIAWRRNGYPQDGLERMLREGLLELPSEDRGDPNQKEAAGGTKDIIHQPSPTVLVRMIRSLQVGRGLDRLSLLVAAELGRTRVVPAKDLLPADRDAEHESDANAEECEAAKRRRIAVLESLAALVGRFQECEGPSGATGTGAPADPLLSGARHFLGTLCRVTSELDAYARARLVEEVDEAVRWRTSDAEWSPTDSSLWLEQLPGELVVMGSGPQPGCIHVSHVIGGGHSGRPHTFIIGLDEARFPGGGGNDPVLTDVDRAEVNAAHTEADLPESGSAGRRNLEAWRRLLARLGGQVRLGFSCRDNREGAEMFPSPALVSLFSQIEGKSWVSIADFLGAVGDAETYVPTSPAAALDESQARLADIDPKEPPAISVAALQAHRSHLSHGWRAEQERRSDVFTAYDGNVPAAGPTLDPCSPDGREASPNSLETLGACPRRFFFRYGLSIRPPEALADDTDRWLSPLDFGTVLHAVLEKFVRELIDSNDTPRDSIEQSERLVALLDAELAVWKSHVPPVTDVAFNATRDELGESLQTFHRDEQLLHAETGMRPIAIEVAIGVEPSAPGTIFDAAEPVAIDLPGDRKLQVRGRIDRIDYRQDGGGDRVYALWDYKSGSASGFPATGDADPFDQGRKLQHGLYILMLRARIDQAADPRVAGSVERFGYFFPSRKGKGQRLEWTAEQLRECAATVGRLAEIARRGAFLPTTASKDCDYCKFTPVCGDPVIVTRQASRMVRRSTDLQELFDGFIGSSKAPVTLDERSAKPLPFTLTPHAQGPETPPDEAVRRRIRDDLDVNLLVEASAGTGKTTCIIDRLLNLIRQGRAMPQAIVAVTFTKKAAGELRRRLRERLHEQAEAVIDPMERRRLAEAVAHADAMVVGTIHSFAARLLRERAVEAGVDPGFTELDDSAESLVREEAWQRFVEEAPADHPQLLQDLEAVGLRLGDLHYAFVKQFADYGDVDTRPAQPVPPPDIGKLLTALDPFVRKIRGARFSPPQDRGRDELMTDLERFVRNWDRTDQESTIAVMDLVQTLDHEPDLVQKQWPGGEDERPAIRKTAKDAAKQWLDDWNDIREKIAVPALWAWRAHRYPVVIRALAAAKHAFDRLRHERGVLSFQDLLSKTVGLLKSSPGARRAFRERYTHVLVDEFQDTDPIQAEMLLLLCASDPTVQEPLECVPFPGSLFVVGDPKQSLYRFRRADIVTYTRMRGIFAQHGAVVALTTNFRSRSDLVEFANTVFGNEFPAQATAESPAFVASRSGRRDGPVPADAPASEWLAGVRVHRLVRSGRENDAWIEQEARSIAAFIRGAIDGRYRVPRTEEECRKRVAAECSYSDFLIIARERAHLSIYASALQAEGLPVDVTGGRGADHQESLRALRMCLSAIADPDDPVAILALLRGPLFGFSDEDLLAYKQAGGSFYRGVVDPEAADGVLRTRCREAREAFGRWRTWVRRLPVAAALERIVDDAGLLLVAAGQGETGPHGRAVVGLIQKYLEIIRGKRDVVLSVHDCLDLLDDLLEQDARESVDPLAIDPDSDDRVRVMNLHKAKGLESPVVFLGDYRVRSLGDKPEDGPSLHVDRSGRAALGWLAVTRKFGKSKQILAAPPDWPSLWHRERMFEQAEQIRHDYVAATRPGTCLVVSVFEQHTEAKKRPPEPERFTAKGAWERFGVYLDAMPDMPRSVASSATPGGDIGTVARDARQADSTRLRKQIIDRITAISAPTYARITPREALTEPAVGLRYTGHGLGEEWGRAIHRLLELAAQKPSFDVKKAAATILSAEEVSLGHVPAAVGLIERIMASDEWTESSKGTPVFSEVPFSVQVEGASLPPRLQAGDPPVPTVIRGVIDRVFRDATGIWRVLDWKTDSVTDESKARLDDHYRPQVELYAECWRLISDGRSIG